MIGARINEADSTLENGSALHSEDVLVHPGDLLKRLRARIDIADLDRILICRRAVRDHTGMGPGYEDT